MSDERVSRRRDLVREAKLKRYNMVKKKPLTSDAHEKEEGEPGGFMAYPGRLPLRGAPNQ